jgi:hypothetical protein
MSDNVTVQGENTPEFIAYRLMDRIFSSEGKGTSSLTRKEILTTYAQCVATVRSGTYYEQDS